MLPLQGELVSHARQEYAGACPFTGRGDDRFHWWAGSNNWFCRNPDNCPDCPGKPCPSGGMTGWFKDDEYDTSKIEARPRPPRPSMARVYEYVHSLNSKALNYLTSRGIRADTARRFLIGQNCRRLTIPCIVNSKGLTCYGIKKRWLGEPPEEWILKYTLEPGSTGKAIFNYNRLRSRPWDQVLIVESILDCVLLDQMGIAAVAPFGGGSVWDARWTHSFRQVKQIIIVADNDKNGAGLGYAQRKAKMLGRGIVTLPPGEHKDIGEAYLARENIHQWTASFR